VGRAVAGVVVVAAALAASPPAPRAAGGPREAEALRTQALSLGFNLDYDQALTTFERAIAADPSSSASHRLAAATAWTAMVFDQGAITAADYLGSTRDDAVGGRHESRFERPFREHLDRAIALATAGVRARPTDADAHYDLGAAFGLRAAYAGTVEHGVLPSLEPARRAYREQDRAHHLDPNRTDTGLILGLYEYVVTALPAPARLVARLMGYTANRAEGLRLVEQCAFRPGDAQPSALFVLVLLYNREARYDDALRVIERLRTEFPRNRLLWLEAGDTALRAHRPLSAKTSLDIGLTELAHDARPRAPGEIARWQLAHATALVELGEVEAARRELTSGLPSALRDRVRGRIYLQLGRCASLEDVRPRAREALRRAENLCRADGDDECAADARRLLETVSR
jgi:tetratricopeptide (TPR) repeat protein